MKSVRIRSYSGTHFPAFGINTERYSVALRIQSECGKMRTKITPNKDTFHAVNKIQNNLKSFCSDVATPFFCCVTDVYIFVTDVLVWSAVLKTSQKRCQRYCGTSDTFFKCLLRIYVNFKILFVL